METTEKQSKLKVFTSHLGKIMVIGLSISTGFICGEYYSKSKDSGLDKLPMDFKNIHKIQETSIAINERDELMIIDRKSGKYEIYDASVGKVVFRMYASQMSIRGNN
jgi:hypothetical protein